jgi:hypothetical protein
VDGIKIRKIGWAVHVVKMEDESIPKKVLDGKYHNRTPVGKPRARWKSCEGKHQRSQEYEDGGS